MAQAEIAPHIGEEGGEARPSHFVRFSPSQRLEHIMIMAAFTALVLTGLPQKYSDASVSQWIILHLGGIDATRFIHHISAYLFVFLAVYHLGSILRSLFLKRARLAMLITAQDIRDTVTALRYNLGVSEERPRFDRYDFRQKFEYWGMVLGGAIMILSGFILLYPTWITRFLPGQLIPAAKAAHGYEGLMAFLIIIVWHLYGAHFGHGKFPTDTTIFSGKISRERMLAEHPLEYARLKGSAPGDEAKEMEFLPETEGA